MKQTRAFFNRFSIGVTALWLLLFALLPNIGLLVVTVLTRGEQDFVLPQFTLDNYLRLLDPTFLKILWESLWLAFMSTLACLLVENTFQGLVLSQALLSLQLPITIFTQIRLTASKRVMGRYANSRLTNALLLATGIAVTAINVISLAG